MVIPNLHVDGIEALPSEVWLEMSELVQKSVRLLKEEFRVDGVNIGMNLGECGGAGIAEHVHYHIVPRWRKDTNFITTIANTRVYSTDFEKIYVKLGNLILKKF
jgi:diadenosine tetraphosphate (Ap4A) HIT family hydrolase